MGKQAGAHLGPMKGRRRVALGRAVLGSCLIPKVQGEWVTMAAAGSLGAPTCSLRAGLEEQEVKVFLTERKLSRPGEEAELGVSEVNLPLFPRARASGDRALEEGTPADWKPRDKSHEAPIHPRVPSCTPCWISREPGDVLVSLVAGDHPHPSASLYTHRKEQPGQTLIVSFCF